MVSYILNMNYQNCEIMDPLYCEICLFPADREIGDEIVKTSTLFDNLKL
ncbi:MAG: hypothetical protein LBR15_10785 [Methanobrevibacter sp.]|jgi:hypothetical protein|nr:hypothetical protein [Candidatus Methanovirga australis]